MEGVYLSDPNLKVEPAYYSGGIPVFTPTFDEFKDFYKFNKAINKYGMESGIVKVIPPKEWLRSTKSIYNTENLANIKIKNPIIQHINQNDNGVFSQQNVERARTYSIFQWKELSEKSNHQPPAPRGEGRKPERENKRSMRTHKRSNSNPSYNIDTTEFSQERCEALEKIYWKSLTYAEPMYGADALGTLFNEKNKIWNVAHLPNLLDLMDVRLPGVNDAYLYAGLWKATFAWHLEDQDLHSINYLHFGAPKQWYSIPQNQCDRFYEVMKETFHDEYKNCPEFLRHKTFLVSPQFLEKHGIECNHIVHRENEFIITYPYGYHAGFNYGYNLAESVNFALDDWFPIGEKTAKCECIADAVGINVRQLYCKFKGIPYEVPDLISDDDTSNDDEENQSILQDTNFIKQKKSSGKILAKQSKANNSKEGNDKKRKDITKIPPVSKRTKKEEPVRQCFLCPDTLCPEIVNKYPFQVLKSNYKNQTVHRICSSLFPNELKVVNNTVFGLEDISKAQKGLKCMGCKIKMNGACFQCTYGKCYRSFHGTCAFNEGVRFNFKKKDFVCKYHESKVDSFEYIGIETFKTDDFIQLKVQDNYFSGLVKQNKDNSIIVRLFPELTQEKVLNYDEIDQKNGRIKMDSFFLEKSKLKSKMVVKTETPKSRASKSKEKDNKSEIGPKKNYTKQRSPSSPVTPTEYMENFKFSTYDPNDELVTGLNVTNLNLTKQDNFIIETLKEKLPVSMFKELWYNLPGYSNDQIDRYTNDLSNPFPNDPYFIKQLKRKRKSKELLNNKELMTQHGIAQTSFVIPNNAAIPRGQMITPVLQPASNDHRLPQLYHFDPSRCM